MAEQLIDVNGRLQCPTVTVWERWTRHEQFAHIRLFFLPVDWRNTNLLDRERCRSAYAVHVLLVELHGHNLREPDFVAAFKRRQLRLVEQQTDLPVHADQTPAATASHSAVAHDDVPCSSANAAVPVSEREAMQPLSDAHSALLLDFEKQMTTFIRESLLSNGILSAERPTTFSSMRERAEDVDGRSSSSLPSDTAEVIEFILSKLCQLLHTLCERALTKQQPGCSDNIAESIFRRFAAYYSRGMADAELFQQLLVNEMRDRVDDDCSIDDLIRLTMALLVQRCFDGDDDMAEQSVDGKHPEMVQQQLLADNTVVDNRPMTKSAKAKLKRPMKSKKAHRAASFSCPSCTTKFSQEQKQLLHIVRAHKTPFGHLRCLICRSLFNSWVALRAHWQNVRHAKTAADGGDLFACMCCRTQLANIDDLKLHCYSMDHLNALINCTGANCPLDVCKRYFDDEATARKHVQDLHPVCPICDKPQLHEFALTQHQRTVHKKRSWQRKCSHCGHVIMRNFDAHVEKCKQKYSSDHAARMSLISMMAKATSDELVSTFLTLKP